MAKIYKTQDYLMIELSYEADVSSDIATAQIKYEAPDGTTGIWTATHDSINKIFRYSLPLGEPLNVNGRWTVWNYATMTDGRVLPGDPHKFLVSTEGE